MNINLAGKTLAAANVEYTVGLQLSDDYFIRIESPFEIVSPGSVIKLSPEDDAAPNFDPLIKLVGQRIIEAEISDKGTLKVHFENSVSLSVEADPEYEAWTVTGPAGLIIVCLAGGELSVWNAKIEGRDNSPRP